MTQYIKTFACMLLVGLGLTSCLDDDRFDKETINYPDGLALGAWASDYTDGNYEYHAVLTLNAAGDSIFYVHRIGKPTSKDSGVVSRMFVADGVTYDKVAGMCSASAEASAYGEDVPVNVSAAYQRDAQHLTVSIEANKRFVTTVAPTNKMYVEGYWVGGIQNEAGDYTAFFNAILEPGEVENEGTGLAIFGSDLNDAEEITYTFHDGQLVVQSTENEENRITGAFNDIRQLVITDANGNTFVADPQTSDVSVPEYSFDKPLIGNYTYKIAHTGVDPNLILRPLDISNPAESKFAIENWGGGTNFNFTWNRDENSIIVPMQTINDTYDPYGDIYVCDYGTWGELTQQNIAFDSKYDAATATFKFHLIYFVFTSENTVGTFGHNIETFEITGEAPEDATRLKLLMHNSKKVQQENSLMEMPKDVVIPFTF